MTATVLIVDDEPLARQRMRRLLADRADVEVIGECAGGRVALDAIMRLSPSVVLLDVQMPDLDGFAVIASLPPTRLPSIVFVTAHQEHAIRAFEVNACDYLLKPFDRTRFHRAIDRALIRARDDVTDDVRVRALIRAYRARMERESPDASHASPVRNVGPTGSSGTRVTSGAPRLFADRLAVRADQRVRLVQVADVEVFEASDNYVLMHMTMASGPTFRMRSTLQELEQRLDPSRFVRVHRSYIVRAAAVHEIEPWVAGDAVLVMQSGRRVRLSRTHRAALDHLVRVDCLPQRAPTSGSSPP